MASSANTINESGAQEVAGSLDISGPLVFSCISCKTIVGDSYAFICSNESLKTITLSAASSIERSADVYTSKGGYDIGSTYFLFACSVCHASIGRYYLTTSKDLDQVREKFTFSIDNITSYEIGKSKFGKIPEPEIITFGGDGDSEANSNSQHSNLVGDILKIKHVMVDLMERVTALEANRGPEYHIAQPIIRKKMQSVVTNISWVEENNTRQF